MPGPYFDIWICQGRLCRAQGADRLQEAVNESLSTEDRPRVRVLRGGCYGLCELSANVVVRRWDSAADLPETSADRLSLSEQENETVYCEVVLEHVPQMLQSHLRDDTALVALTREIKEVATTAPNSTAEQIRALRQRKGAKSPSR